MEIKNLFRDQRTNWKYILIIVILAAVVGGVILVYQYWWMPKEEVKAPEEIKNETTDEFIKNLLILEIEKLNQQTSKDEGIEYKLEEMGSFKIDDQFYAMAIFEGTYGDVLKIYQLENSYLVNLSMPDFRGFIRHKLRSIKDINNDNSPEVIINSSTGGNCSSCNKIIILEIKNKEVKSIKINIPNRIILRDIIDLNNNGLWEIVGTDSHWEFYKNVCHACSPSVEIIVGWEDGDYRIISSRFPDYYDKNIKMIKERLEKPFNEQYYFGDLVSLFLNYLMKGENEKGLEEFRKYADSFNFKSLVLKEEIQRIENNLEEWIEEEGVNELLKLPE